MTASSSTQDTMEVAVTLEAECKLCLQQCPLGEMYEMEECKCSYCHLCMKQYIEVCVSEGNVLSIMCPDAQCEKQGELQNMEIQNLVDEQTFEKFIRLKTDQEVDLDPSRSWCPKVGCETICHVSSDSAENSEATPVECPTCSLVFCSECKAKWHENHSCDPDDDGIPLNPSVDAQFKRCPSCKVALEFGDGCPVITCKRCKHSFCWYCLSSLKGDFLLRHYDKGPCKNKYGIPAWFRIMWRCLPLIVFVILAVVIVVLIFEFV